LFCALFFSCFPLFLRRRLFSRPRKALHCNWRRFFPVNRLYFCFGLLDPCAWGLCQRSSARAPVFSLYFTGNREKFGVGPSGRDGARLQRDSADIGRIGLVLLFCADPKTVASNSGLKLQIVLMGRSFSVDGALRRRRR
jgi:hypothetical protein